MQHRPYLMAWRLGGRKVVIVGGGSIGTAKVETLLDSGANLVVIDPHPSDRVVHLASTGAVRLVARQARPTDLLGASLLVAATGESDTNRRLKRWATLGGLLRGTVVNAVDDVENCDVTVPAVVRRGPATIAITTGGATPAGARFLREELTEAVDRALPLNMSSVLEHASSARHELRVTGRYRYDYRRWKQCFFEPALAAVRAGQPDLIGQQREHFVRNFEQLEPECGPALQPGHVTLVGAGPGERDLITVRGARALSKANVVVYDRLADPGLLDLAPPAAERIPVGKAKGSGTPQDVINELLVSHATAGSHVVRLKGGDPFVFGRGAEEARAVADAGIQCEVIPGVSSSVAAPALAGIPVTDRRAAGSFTVMTGHHAEASDQRWRALGQTADTIVVLMGASTARSVATMLHAGGRQATEPVAFIHQAGSPDQEVHRTTIAEVALRGCPFPAPTVMVVGPVVDLAPDSSFYTPGEPSNARAADDLAYARLRST